MSLYILNTTVGIELEFNEVIKTEDLITQYDGSITTKIIEGGRSIEVGTEFVTFPRKMISMLESDIYRIYTVALTNGGFIDERVSMHVHLELPKEFRRVSFLKYLIEHLYNNDEHLIRIGAFGAQPRGELNDYSYMRPYRSPLIVKWRVARNRFIKVFDVKKIVKSKFKGWRDLIIFMGDEYLRYNAARYVTVNIMSLLEHRTIEFRVFSTPPDVDTAMTVIRFCKAYLNMLINDFLTNKTLKRSVPFDIILDYLGDIGFIKKDIIERIRNWYYKGNLNIRDNVLFHRISRGFSSEIHYHMHDNVTFVDPAKIVYPVLSDYSVNTLYINELTVDV